MLMYLSGPMTGVPEYNYRAFHDAAKVLRGHGFSILNPAETAGGATHLPRETYMHIDVGYVAAADGVVVLPGWQNSKGSKLECILAVSLGLPIFTYDPQHGIGTRVDISNWGVSFREIKLMHTADNNAAADTDEEPEPKVIQFPIRPGPNPEA